MKEYHYGFRKKTDENVRFKCFNQQYKPATIRVNQMRMFSGCYTALITPMKKDGGIDFEGFRSLIDFQAKEAVQGVLAVGTTGESPTLDWEEHIKVIEEAREHMSGKCLVMAGTGSNSTKEAIQATQHAYNSGLRFFILVDPYYNGPSSIEIRKEYIEPIVRLFPEAQFIPYIIPGRTGTQLMPQDLAVLHSQFQNVRSVKEATANLENMKLTRKLCGGDFDILSGDDDKTYDMMVSSEIAASGVISVISNIAPGAVQKMVQHLLEQDLERASRLCEALKPLFSLVTVKTDEQSPYGRVPCKARNPLPCKTLMNVLGMPSGPLRQPLGKMTRAGLETVINQARQVYEKSPNVLRPVEEFFNVDLSRRLYEEIFWKGLYYG
jgi:4-hydroxy-tetrahydrodipicolinate synthase